MSGASETFDVIVLGGGAAGLMCAATAGQRGKRVLLLEHNDALGKKILISGGGRCNFTNINTAPTNFLSQNPHFAKSALARYRPTDFTQLVESYGIAYYEKTLGQLFCKESSRQIVNLLESECRKGNVEIRLKQRVEKVSHDDGFVLETFPGAINADALVVATGGLSIPKLGATSVGYKIAKQFGLTMVDPYPALVPLTWNESDRRWRELSGVSFSSVTRIDGIEFAEKTLFTHRGLSGPAILQISSYWKPGISIVIDSAPSLEIERELLERKRSGDKAELKNALTQWLPSRFATAWCEARHVAGSLADLPDVVIHEVVAALHSWEISPGGTEGFAKAEVTGGGVSTEELSSQTFEAKRVPGLYFIGEVVDVTGHLGGYNFQWAWASAVACGESV